MLLYDAKKMLLYRQKGVILWHKSSKGDTLWHKKDVTVLQKKYGTLWHERYDSMAKRCYCIAKKYYSMV